MPSWRQILHHVVDRCTVAQRRLCYIVLGMVLVPAVANAYWASGGSGSGSSSNTWFGATLPTLPTQFSTTSNPPTPTNTCRGSYYTPGVGGDASLTLQAALNDAAAGGCANGDVIELQAGTTYTASTVFTLPARSGSSVGPVYVISSDAPEIGGAGLPAAGTPVFVRWPAAGTLGTSTTGGSLAAGTYYYVVTATDAAGESTHNPQLSITTTGSTSANTLTWTPSVGATGYKVYRSTASGNFNGVPYYTVSGGSSSSFVDTGATTSTATPPVADTTVNLSTMAAIRSSQPNTGGPVISRAAGAAYYRLVGLDIELQDSNAAAGTNYYTINFQNGDTSTSTLAQHITIDRCYIAGSPSYGVEHAVDLDGDYMELTESKIDGGPLTETGDADSNAVLIINSLGPYKIHDNYLTARGEITLVGGSDTTLPEPSEPSDITVTNNHYYKPTAIGAGTITSGSTSLAISSISYGTFQVGMHLQDAEGDIPNGTTITAITGSTATMSATATGNASAEGIVGLPGGKNALEFKTGQRVLFQSNYVENAGDSGQPRSAFVLTARNQSGTNPWYALTDYTIEDNVFTNGTNGGMNWLLQDSTADEGAYDTGSAQRILLRDDLFLLSINFGGSSYSMSLLSSDAVSGTSPPASIVVDHCTIIGTASLGANSALIISMEPSNNFVWSNTIFDLTQYPFEGGEGVSPTTFAAAVSAYVTDLAFLANVITGASDSTIPAGNYTPSTNASVGYLHYGSNTLPNGYALSSSSPYHGAGVSGLGLPYNSAGMPDGSDIGANVSLLPTN